MSCQVTAIFQNLKLEIWPNFSLEPDFSQMWENKWIRLELDSGTAL